jgi:hypothetical protein
MVNEYARRACATCECGSTRPGTVGDDDIKSSPLYTLVSGRSMTDKAFFPRKSAEVHDHVDIDYFAVSISDERKSRYDESEKRARFKREER